MEPAKNLNNPTCADVTVRLPSDISGFDKRGTNAQATGAWGNPDVIMLRCGIEPSGPTTETCVSVDGVDWIVETDSQKPSYRFEAYGRSPGLEVIVNSQQVSGTDVLLELAPVANLLPQERKCTSLRRSTVTNFNLRANRVISPFRTQAQ